MHSLFVHAVLILTAFAVHEMQHLIKDFDRCIVTERRPIYSWNILSTQQKYFGNNTQTSGISWF